MARRVLSVAAMLVLVAGCGESTPSTPVEVGLLHLGKGRYEQAIAACDEAIRLNPRDANAYLVRGRAYQFRNGKGDADRAVADFSESIRIEPKQTEAYYSRAIVYRDQGDAEKSMADDVKARQLDTSIEETYSHLPETTQPLGLTGLEKAAGETSSATPTETTEPADDPLMESLRQRRQLGLDAQEPRSGSAAAGTDPRATRRNGTRDQFDSDAQFSPRADGETSNNRPKNNSNPSYGGPKGQAYNRSKSWNMPLDSQDVLPQLRAGERMGRDGARAGNGSRWNEAAGPVAPDRSRGGRLSDLPRLPSPVQSPFPQLPPRPTGFVEEKTPTPLNSQPRQTFSNPYVAPPTVHPPGAYHEDFNP